MPYVDGYVVPVPKANVAAYVEMSTRAGQIWREFGALEFRECMADDVKPGKLTSFPQSVLAEPDETIFFSWIVFASKQDRDAINERVMKDPRLADMMDPATMPFDGKRMFYGGFDVKVDL